MRITSREPGPEDRTRVGIVPETVDDLWHVSHVLEPGDRVAADTTRRVRRDDEELRDTGGEREHMHVTLAVAADGVEFARFANRLRVGGEIVACSREDEIGHHHTLNVETNDELSVEKRWKPDQLERIEQAEAAAEDPDVAVATVEEGAAYVHLVAEHGTEEYGSFVRPTGKGEYAQPRTALFDELGAALERLDVDALVVAGPGFTKEDALDHVEGAYDIPPVTVVDTAGVGDRGVHEVLTRGAVDDIRSETRVAREAELIDELMQRVGDGAKATYGPAAVAEAAEMGAVETLLVVDDHLRAARAGGQAVAGDGAGDDGAADQADGADWSIDVNEVIERVEQQGGDVVVFSSEFDPGRQLDGLGGIAALLRYRVG